MGLTPITVNGKLYLVSPIRRAGDYGAITVREDYVGYYATRDGKRFGPARDGAGSSRPGTLGRAIFDAADSLTKA